MIPHIRGEMSSVKVHGRLIDNETRCIHFHSAVDVIAIKFKCCGKYYPCYRCHEETADHAAAVWNRNEWHEKAILCGVCKTELAINEYLQSGSRCPECSAGFNPNCSRHYHLYFQIET